VTSIASALCLSAPSVEPLYEVGERTCRACGCTEHDCRGCIERTGEPCHWIDIDLCSACAADSGVSSVPPSLRASVAAPLSFNGLRIFASRDDDRVTGRVEFPYAMHGRNTVSIDYHSRRPEPPPPLSRGDQGGSSIPSRAREQADDPCRDSNGAVASLDAKASIRLALVTQWRTLCDHNPNMPRKALAEKVAELAPIKCSWRTIQMWASKLDALGPEGLIDGYIPAPKKVLTLDGRLASDAVLVCAWWSFRIGNNDSIDTKMMHSAAGLLTSPLAKGGHRRVEASSSSVSSVVLPSSLRASVPEPALYAKRQGCLPTPPSSLRASMPSCLPVADILAVIDCYYAWPCNRSRMPFKPFSRWVRYDFEKWLFRAAAENDYRRTIAEQRDDHRAVDPIPGVDKPVPLMDPPYLSPCQGETQRGGVTSRLRACPPSKTRRRDALDRSTRQSIRALSPPLVRGGQGGVQSPTGDRSTVAEALVSLDDSYRIMLLRAAAGDSDAKRQALSTMPLWWCIIPDEVRSGIERATDIPLSERRPGDDRRIALARLRLFLPTLRRSKAGYETLRVGAGVIP